MSRRALRHGVGLPYEHKALLKGLGPINTILDVGANVGQFSVLCRIVLPNAKIHAFEPMVEASNKFKIILGSDPLVVLHRCALGSQKSKAEIHLAARADSSSIMPQAQQAKYFPSTSEVGTETIRIARLSDELSLGDLVGPTLLKIDVQGFEGEVLRGCEGLLDQIDWIYCEASFKELYRDQPLAHEVICWLAERGFGLAGVVVGPDMVFEGRAVQADFLFSRIVTAA